MLEVRSRKGITTLSAPRHFAYRGLSVVAGAGADGKKLHELDGMATIAIYGVFHGSDTWVDRVISEREARLAEDHPLAA